MVDNLLDIMTGGDHRKTKKLLEEKKKIREDEEMEEKRLKSLLESKKPSTSLSTCAPLTSSTNGTPLFVQTMNSSIKSATVSPVSAGISKSVAEDLKIEINQLKSLSELGIDTSFIDYYGENNSADVTLSASRFVNNLIFFSTIQFRRECVKRGAEIDRQTRANAFVA